MSGSGGGGDADHSIPTWPGNGKPTDIEPDAVSQRPSIDDGGGAQVIAAARREATRLLAPCGTRLAHVAAAARAAIRVSCTVGDEDVGLLVAAAWLHDIGYALEIARTGFHPLDGGLHLRSVGFDPRLCRLVANHTSAWAEADARGLGAVLESEFPAEHSASADALTYADLTTGPGGQTMTVDERLGDILARYELGHVVHQSIRRALPSLRASVERVEQRLAVASGGGVARKRPAARATRVLPAVPVMNRNHLRDEWP